MDEIVFIWFGRGPAVKIEENRGIENKVGKHWPPPLSFVGLAKLLPYLTAPLSSTHLFVQGLLITLMIEAVRILQNMIIIFVSV